MNRLMLMKAAGFSLLVPTISFAQTLPAPAPEMGPTTQTVASPDQPLICKHFYYNGRTLPRSECLTAHEWERMRNETQRNISDFQLRSLTQGPH